MVLVQLAIHTQKNEIGPPHNTIHKISFKMDYRPYVTANTIKFLEENTEVKFCDLDLGNGVFDMTAKVLKE